MQDERSPSGSVIVAHIYTLILPAAGILTGLGETVTSITLGLMSDMVISIGSSVICDKDVLEKKIVKIKLKIITSSSPDIALISSGLMLTKYIWENGSLNLTFNSFEASNLTMKIFQKSVPIRTKELNDFVEMTEEVQEVVNESKIKNGMVFVNSMHNTAAVIIQEADSTIHRDLVRTLEKLIPLKAKYEHDYEGNVNATAHLKSNMLGSFLTVPLKDSKLILGTWQRLFFIEFFEARNRKVVVTVVGE